MKKALWHVILSAAKNRPAAIETSQWSADSSLHSE